MSHLDDWIEIAKECKYLPENDLKVSLELLTNELIIKLIID
jgi:hypothetical protein